MYWQSIALGNVITGPFIGWIGRMFSLQVALMTSVLALSPSLWLLTRNQNADEPSNEQA